MNSNASSTQPSKEKQPLANFDSKQPKRVQIITGKGVSIYPKVNKADTKFDAAGQYNCKVRLSAADSKIVIDQHETLKQAMMVYVKEQLEEQAKSEDKEKAKAAKVKLKALKFASDNPYKPAVDEEGDETGEFEFNFKMAAQYTERKTGTVKTQRPKLIDSKGKDLDPSRVSVWGGSIVKIGGFLSPFHTAIGVGVSLKLRQVQIVKLVTGNGGENFNFGAEEDGYEGDDESSPAESQVTSTGDTSGEPDEF